MKKIMLAMLLSGMWHSMYAQSHGIEQYYSVGPSRSSSIMPVIYYETGANWHIEGRYNYEAPETFSLYAGKTFRKESLISWSVNPIVGIVRGKYNGFSAGLNIEAEYKKYLLTSQSQYTVSTKVRNQNFAYSWTDISYLVCRDVAAGFSIQHTKVRDNKLTTERGVFIKVIMGNWSVPVYLFNALKTQPYFMIGLNYEWKKNKL